jgi:hypothetical protein
LLGRNGSLLLGATAISCLLLAQPARADSTERTSLTNAGDQSSGGSFGTRISADGRFVSFISNGTDLVAGDNNSSFDVFVRDRLGGTTQRVSVSSAGGEGDDDSTNHVISADGRFVVFMSEADNLVVGDSGGSQNIFLHDRQTGVTELINVSSGEDPASDGSFSDQPEVSVDGRYVVFQSDATNLVGDDTNATYDIFVRDRQAGTRSG